ncbi:hypothetical protein SAMN05421810_107109 [Amycolatopsis arida]|uniref:Uncharacterized protein n=1 Tax=Amycolatopsis arida TaxID=587909 RepID=A0A1I5YEX3_9PSEU|nr:DUF6069 family protein [Amycolatopsis arida]TDX90465.1 hypothetical protein CLV69_107109 [Amycolatopsis arida]SFQ42749.1 hypothetical protein SAMN05421810_107109 [Amycolatopsis arida]
MGNPSYDDTPQRGHYERESEPTREYTRYDRTGHDRTGYDRGPSVDTRTLWMGGLATALVAALVAVVAVLITDGVFDVPVIAPANTRGAFDYVGAGWLAAFAAIAALLATAIAHLLLLLAPRPMAFFTWIIALGTVAFAVLPFTTSVRLPVQLTNAAIYLVIGVAIGTLIAGMAGRAQRPRRSSY